MCSTQSGGDAGHHRSGVSTGQFVSSVDWVKARDGAAWHEAAEYSSNYLSLNMRQCGRRCALRCGKCRSGGELVMHA